MSGIRQFLSIGMMREAILNEINEDETVLLVRGGKSFDKCGAVFEVPEVFNKTIVHTGLLTKDIVDDYLGNTEVADVVIAVGGGSVIDLGKILGNESKVIAVPTTAGSGAEATSFATIYDDHENLKYSIDCKVPDVVVLNYKLVMSMDRYLAACTGLDALSHAIESLNSVNANDESRTLADIAKSIIEANLFRSTIGLVASCRELMQWGAYIAGRAINISKTGAAHALSYPLTIRWNVPHGHAVALMMGEFADYNTRKLMKAMGMKTKLSEFNITDDDLPWIVDHANVERLENSRVKFSKKQMIQKLRKIL